MSLVLQFAVVGSLVVVVSLMSCGEEVPASEAQTPAAEALAVDLAPSSDDAGAVAAGTVQAAAAESAPTKKAALGAVLSRPTPAEPGEAVSASAAKGTVLFTDQALKAGLDFVHFNGMSGEFYYSEMVGSGAAMFDYDNDGDLDLYLVQGRMLGPGKTLTDALFPAPPKVPLKGRLYRNDLSAGGGSRRLTFTDVTDESGISATGYGMGVATGDFDNDGWVDLYLTNFGSNQMWRNNGDGTFTDVTGRAGTGDSRWSVSAAFLDFDRDGWLDLYVGNYVDYSFTNQKQCLAPTGAEDYCGPLGYEPVPERLFRNRGDGAFEDVSAKSKIAAKANGALGVVCADLNRDGWIDIYVANDGRPNHLWLNQHDGTFAEEAMLSGCALNRDGFAESSMGVDAGDVDNDGDDDLLMTNLTGEKTTLFVNDGDTWYDDASYETGLALPSKSRTGFGTALFDFDNDGWLDVLTVNGEVRTIPGLAQAGDRYPLDQRKQLFRNMGNGRFEEITDRAGKAFQSEDVGRGAAFGDVDNDGDMDVLVVNSNGRTNLLVNESANAHHWVGLRLMDAAGKRDVLGTRVAVERTNGPTLWRRVRTDGSYCSASDPRVLVGLGKSAKVESVRVFWTSGRVEEWSGIDVDRYTTLREGAGKKIP